MLPSEPTPTEPAWRLDHDLAEADFWFRDLVWAAHGITESKTCRRIFISWRASQGRWITNEAEVETFLRALGIETVVMEELAFGQQVELFAEAQLSWAATVGFHEHAVRQPRPSDRRYIRAAIHEFRLLGDE